MPTSIIVESNYQMNLILQYKSDIDQISFVMRENVNSMDECASLAKPSLYFNPADGFITLNVFRVLSDGAPQPAHDHDNEPAHSHDNESAHDTAPTSNISSATKLSSIFINVVGVISFFFLFQKHHRMSLFVLGVTLLFLPYSLSHSECQSGRLALEINIPVGMNLRFIRVHSEGQSVCMDPSGKNCGDDSSMNPCSSIWCMNGGICNQTTAECACKAGYSGALCQDEKNNFLRREIAEIKENVTWTDGKENYTVVVDTAPCDHTNGNFSVTFESTESMEYVTLMYQFASKCDAKHCDCSTPIAMTATDATNKTYAAVIRGSGKAENALYMYSLYKAPSWKTRNQYPIDALPHQFIKTPIGCDGAVDGPCDANNCWIALGQKGCSP